jgi:hypothetical protein
LHHPGTNILTFNEAFSEQTAVSVRADQVAIPWPSGRIVDESITRGNAAGPLLAFGVEANLIGFGCVNP